MDISFFAIRCQTLLRRRNTDIYIALIPTKLYTPFSFSGCPELSSDVIIVKTVSAFGTEFGWICGIFGLPAALIATVERCARRLLCSAIPAEFALIYCTASALPTIFGGLGASAFGTEFTHRFRTASALP